MDSLDGLHWSSGRWIGGSSRKGLQGFLDAVSAFLLPCFLFFALEVSIRCQGWRTPDINFVAQVQLAVAMLSSM
jgi:hypothetical protein